MSINYLPIHWEILWAVKQHPKGITDAGIKRSVGLKMNDKDFNRALTQLLKNKEFDRQGELNIPK